MIVAAARKPRRTVVAGRIDLDAAARLEAPAAFALDLRSPLPGHLYRRRLFGGHLGGRGGFGRGQGDFTGGVGLGVGGGQFALERIYPLRHGLHLRAHGGQFFLNRGRIGGTRLRRQGPSGRYRQRDR